MNAEKPAVLFTEEMIRKRVAEMACRISSDYADLAELLLVGILRGCFIFLADLSRLLTVPRSVDFIAVSSYGRTTTSTGAVRLIMDLRNEISGKHVLIVDDVVDTGHTLQYLINALKTRGPASLKTCVFLRKRERFKLDCEIDYLGSSSPTCGSWGTGWITPISIVRFHMSAPLIPELR